MQPKVANMQYHIYFQLCALKEGAAHNVQVGIAISVIAPPLLPARRRVLTYRAMTPWTLAPTLKTNDSGMKSETNSFFLVGEDMKELAEWRYTTVQRHLFDDHTKY